MNTNYFDLPNITDISYVYVPIMMLHTISDVYNKLADIKQIGEPCLTADFLPKETF